MKSDDLPYYGEFLELMRSEKGLRVILSYPDDYIALLRENSRLREEISSLKRVEYLYGNEVIRSIQAEDKLKWLHRYLDDNDIFVPNFKW